MSRTEEVELTNMCMICDGKGNESKVEITRYGTAGIFRAVMLKKGEYVTPSVIREMQEETGLTIKAPRLWA